MAKVKVKIDGLKRRLSAKEVSVSKRRELGEVVDEKVKTAISVGRSPVKGAGRFKPYAAQRPDAIGDYPKGIPNKNVRPVNLNLTGQMLAAITYKIIKGGISYGLQTSVGKLKEIFRVHNEGLRKDIPQRKMIPIGQETFTKDILKAIEDVYIRAIRDIIKRSK